MVTGRSLGVAGFGWAQWAAKKTGRTGWVLLTTAVVTLVPLVFEVSYVHKTSLNVLFVARKYAPRLSSVMFSVRGRRLSRGDVARVSAQALSAPAATWFVFFVAVLLMFIKTPTAREARGDVSGTLVGTTTRP